MKIFKEVIMNQNDYDLICKILENGAPALAGELINKLDNLITDYQNVRKRVESMSTTSEDK